MSVILNHLIQKLKALFLEMVQWRDATAGDSGAMPARVDELATFKLNNCTLGVCSFTEILLHRKLVRVKLDVFKLLICVCNVTCFPRMINKNALVKI